jgi:tetratricopeptide (TPR) repeat protein
MYKGEFRMRRLSEMSLDELYDVEEKLLQELDSGGEKDGIYSEMVMVYEQIYHKLTRLLVKERKERNAEIDYVTQKLVTYLITYGTYLKIHIQKDDYVAKNSFRKALKYDKTNPIAHYRLGFLAYKEQQYAEALHYFEKALQYQNGYPNKRFSLNEQQMYYAHLYLANSALFVAEKTYQSMEKLPDHINKDKVASAELSSLYELLQRNETILKTQAFIKVTPSGETYCSKEECERIIIAPPKNTVILYFSDRANVVAFNGKETALAIDPAEMFCYFLLKTNQKQPARKKDLEVFFESKRRKDREVPKNTFIQKVNRLRNKLNDIGLPLIIESCQFKGETAYFYNGSVDYLIMYRSDYTFMFDDTLR